MAPASFRVNRELSSKNLIIILFLLLLGAIFFRSVGEKPFKTNSAAFLECYRVEILMRMVDIFDYLPQFILQTDQRNLEKKEYTKNQAIDLIESAYDKQPKSIVILCKKIILKTYLDKSVREDLHQLNLLSSFKEEESLTGKNRAKIQDLAKLILLLYTEGYSAKDKLNCLRHMKVEEIVHSSFANSWFSEKVLLKIYLRENENRKYKDLSAEVESKTWHYIAKLALLGLVGTFAMLVGIIVIICRIIPSFKKLSRYKEDQNRLQEQRDLQASSIIKQYDWRTVLLVFLAWFCTQILVALIANFLKQRGLFISYSNSLSVAISVTLIYLLSNGLAILYIYCLAFKPNNLHFINGLSLYFKTPGYEKEALIMTGILGWLAAIPIVIVAHFISVQFLGSQGSVNPIIGIVMEAAQSNGFLAILLFYFTLGVLAPFCEEILFRGFLYSYLRNRCNIIFANIFSSAFFALAHFDAGAALPLFCLGSIFAYLCEETGSIVPSMITHGLWNSVSFTLVLILFGN